MKIIRKGLFYWIVLVQARLLIRFIEFIWWIIAILITGLALFMLL